MNKLNALFAVSAAALLFTACKKDVKDAPEEQVSATVLAQIKNLGFNTDGVQKINEGYLVEGDIILSNEDLASVGQSHELVYANEEHYRTTKLVNTSTYSTIRVALKSSSASHQAVFSAALNEAIRRYNAERLRVRFQRVSSNPHTTLTAYYEVSNTLGSAGFPTSTGAPYSQVRMNTFHYSTSTSAANVNYIATIIAHELGHCIGFRHTDYMNRSFSCGGFNYNEGSAGVGAIHVPGTPTGPSTASWMLACIGGGVNRPFTSADRKALRYVY